MLNIIANKGLIKQEQDTPFEFLSQVDRESNTIRTEVATVTDSFCKTFYGEKALTKTELSETELALKRLKERCSDKAAK